MSVSDEDLIKDGIKWLEERERDWHLDLPIDKRSFIKALWAEDTKATRG